MALALSEFALQCVPQKAMKGQALADFLVDHSFVYIEKLDMCEMKSWKVLFDGSRSQSSSGARVVLNFTFWN